MPQYRPTHRDWQPHDAEIRMYPERHPHHWLWRSIQRQELELLACELDPMRGRPDIYDRIAAEEKAKGSYFLFPPPPKDTP